MYVSYSLSHHTNFPKKSKLELKIARLEVSSARRYTCRVISAELFLVDSTLYLIRNARGHLRSRFQRSSKIDNPIFRVDIRVKSPVEKSKKDAATSADIDRACVRRPVTLVHFQKSAHVSCSLVVSMVLLQLTVLLCHRSLRWS
jgi:hypothetical protein